MIRHSSVSRNSTYRSCSLDQKRVSRPIGGDMTTLESGVWWNEAEKFLPFCYFRFIGQDWLAILYIISFSQFAVLLKEIG